MAAEKNIPEIRFKGFEGEWEDKMLIEFVDKAVDNRGKTPPVSIMGTHPLIEVASLGFGNPDYSKVEKYLDDYSFDYFLRDYIKKGDILFSTVGSIGLVSLMDSNENAAIAQNIVAFRAKNGFYSEYLYALLSTKKNKDKAYRIVMGAVQPSIKVSQLAFVEYFVSLNLPEQTQIGTYFQHLDSLISLHQRKYDKLLTVKKAMLEKMFPKEGADVPEIRFKGFEGKWEKKKLGDVSTYVKGFAFKSVDYNSEGIRIIRVSDLLKDSISYNVDNKYIDKDKAKLYFNYKINCGDIVITTVGSKAELKDSAVGRPIIFNENNGFLLNQNLVKITPIINHNSQFIFNQLLTEKYTSYIEDIQRGNANQANITINDLWAHSLQCPVLEEQTKIGTFFQNLDTLITQHQKQLEKLKNLKKACLEKMFV